MFDRIMCVVVRIKAKGHFVMSTIQFMKEICPEMHPNEIHELYYRHHKVSPNLNIILSNMKSYDNLKKACFI